MIFLFFLFILCDSAPTTVPPPTCPYGFTVLNDDKCVKLIDTPMDYPLASYHCKSHYTGGYLVSVKNAIDNRALASIAVAQGHTEPVWLGLTCYIWDFVSCMWEDGKAGNAVFGYNSFAKGNPYLSVETNVYLETSGSSAGKWFSNDVWNTTLKFFCEVPTNNRKFFCPNEFNDSCYTINLETPYLNETGARKYCQSECGDLVSIHSKEEADYVFSLYPFTSAADPLRIGARSDGNQFFWTDNSPVDYNDFGYFNSDMGKCACIPINNNVVDYNQWTSSECSDEMAFFCKRPKNVQSCDVVGPTEIPNSVTIPTAYPVVSTQDPNGRWACSNRYFYTGNGTVYSPGYPNTYDLLGGACSYVITTPSGTYAQVQFSSETFLDGANMYFYSSLDKDGRFFEFTAHSPPYPIISTTNVILMVFDHYGIPAPNAKFVANYGHWAA